MKRGLTFWAPVTAVCFGVLWFAGTARPWRSPEGEMDLAKFATLPVVDRGRIKPIDTFASVELMLLNRRQTYYDEFDKKKQKKQQAVKWLLNVLSEGYAGALARLPFTVADPELRGWFTLPAQAGFRYDLRDLANNEAAMERLRELEKKRSTPEKMTPVERKAMALMESLKGRQTEGDRIMDVREKKGTSYRAEIFRIDNDQVLAMLGLPIREGFRYSLAEILGTDEKTEERGKRFKEFMAKARQTHERPEKDRDLVEVKTLELDRNLRVQSQLRSLDGLLMVPPPEGGVEGWKTLGDALASSDPAAEPWERMLAAYGRDEVKTFNKEVDAYAAAMKEKMPSEMARARVEVWFNHFAPFYQCSILYVIVLLLSILSWGFATQPLRLAAFWLAAVVCVVHTLALVVRIYLTGRPPVTNLYTSAVFIGWGCVLLGLVVEFLTRKNRFAANIPVTVAAVLGFATMIIAHHLGGSGDTMEVMQAVLDTNFWLATHVTTVTLGYTATFVAGFLAMVFIFRMLASVVRLYQDAHRPLVGAEPFAYVAAVIGLAIIPTTLAVAVLGGLWVLFSDGEPLDLPTLAIMGAPLYTVAAIAAASVVLRRLSPEFLAKHGNQPTGLTRLIGELALTKEASQGLSGMVYGVICFATLLSFVGTVLGGIWADQSWGRFWGWDPKENGAVLIVIMNALILHARWGGMIKERGMCVLAVLGNMVTAWSWFGTNQLGVGLHAYGFNNTLALGCALFWVSQVGLAALGMLPLSYWRAFAEAPAVAAPRVTAKASTGIQPA
jgi:ABC-type transport system involved in cytochrome c biogenesis permease subunit